MHDRSLMPALLSRRLCFGSAGELCQFFQFNFLTLGLCLFNLKELHTPNVLFCRFLCGEFPKHRETIWVVVNGRLLASSMFR